MIFFSVNTVHISKCSSMIKKQAAGTMEMTAATSRSAREQRTLCNKFMSTTNWICVKPLPATNTAEKLKLNWETASIEGSLVS